MGLNLDITAVGPVLKNRYTDKKVETISFQSPLLALMPKKTDLGGAQYIGAIRNAIPSSRSATDSTAFTVGASSGYKQWAIPWKSDYASANITGAAIDQANGDINALVDAMSGETDGMFEALGQSIGAALFQNGGGAIGQVASGQATATITLTDPTTAVNFWVGMLVQASVDDGTLAGGLRNAGAAIAVTGVDLVLGTVTAGAAWTGTIAALVANDYLFMQGDYAAKVCGLKGWIPPPANRPTGGDSFFGVNRSVDPIRLAGVYYSGNGAPKSESLIQLCALIDRFQPGGTLAKPLTAVVNHLDMADIMKELSTRVVYTDATAFENPQIGFPAIQVATPKGMMKIIADPFCPQGTAWALDLSTWLLLSMGKVPKVLAKSIDGTDWLRNAGADSYQMRGGYRGNTYCAAPSRNGVVTF